MTHSEGWAPLVGLSEAVYTKALLHKEASSWRGVLLHFALIWVKKRTNFGNETHPAPRYLLPRLTQRHGWVDFWIVHAVEEVDVAVCGQVVVGTVTWDILHPDISECAPGTARTEERGLNLWCEGHQGSLTDKQKIGSVPLHWYSLLCVSTMSLPRSYDSFIKVTVLVSHNWAVHPIHRPMSAQ